MELEDEEEDEGEESTHQPDPKISTTVQQAKLLGISLHAIVGAPSPNTMRLLKKLNLHIIIVLVDTGSIHSFIDIKRTAKLPVETSHLLRSLSTI